MPSQYFITIRLDPHYQRFLRSRYKCKLEIFEFTARNYFNILLRESVITKPPDFIEKEVNDYSFKIALPNFRKKNVKYYKYLTKNEEAKLVREIKQEYQDDIIRRFSELHKCPLMGKNGSIIILNLKQTTLRIIDEFGFDLEYKDSFDRIYKLLLRFLKRERIQMYDPNKIT